MITLALLAAAAAPLPPPGYRAGWVAVPRPAVTDLRVEKGKWVEVASFRPADLFVLDQPVVRSGEAKAEIAAGTRMIGLSSHAATACELERPRGDYFVGCVEDKDGDGRYETFFRLNHGNPFLFSATRQPRHKDVAIGAVTLTRRTAADADMVGMVLLYTSTNALNGNSSFSLCVLRPNNGNIWGDKTVARGCLPPVMFSTKDMPRDVRAYGRTITVRSVEAGTALLSVSGADADLPVLL